MVSKRNKRIAGSSLSAQGWVEAGLVALAHGGGDAVAVEPLARSLGVTKGSFYWHFKDQAALLEAIVAEWEERTTTRVILELSKLVDPRERLTSLFRRAVSSALGSSLEFAIAAVARAPRLARQRRRVVHRRVDFLIRCYLDLGYDRPEARRRAAIAYATYVGTLTLCAEHAIGMPRTPAEQLAYAEDIIDALVVRRSSTR
jgi:AcrR family transcriptional regulator